MGIVGVVVNGKWQAVDDGQPSVSSKPATRTIDAIGDPVDQTVAHLAEVVRLAQGLSEVDARRVRDFVVATSAMLSATTYLPQADQGRFERALRQTANRGN